MASNITIDLDIREEAGVFGTEQLIQQKAIHTFKTRLYEIYKGALKYKKNASTSEKPFDRMLHRVYNTIILHGGRGSGKTTLLNSLIDTFRGPASNKKLFTEQDFTGDSPLGRVYVLDVIDPSLVETKEHVLITIIGMIKSAVDRQLDGQQGRHPIDKYRRSGWEQSLTEISEGLTRLDGIGSSNPHESWEDALYITQKGLQGAQGSIVFEAALADFVRQSLEILDKDLFLIAFDDIDTAIDRGFDVLEIIRKYLATPLILVVLAGDLDLYSKVVRLEYWRKFKPEKMLPGETSIYLKKVNELEDQYLMKLLKPANRIALLNLDSIFNRKATLLKRRTVSRRVQEQDTEQAQITYNQTKRGSLIDFINTAITSVYGVERNDQVDRYRSLILRQPTRTVLQFLRSFAAMDPKADFPGLPVVLSIADITLGPLLRSQLNATEVAEADPQQVLLITRDFIDRRSLWVSGYRLHPDILDEDGEDTNLVLLALGAAMMRAIRVHPLLIFDYFIKLCLPHSAFEYVPQKEGRITQYLDFVSGKSFEDSQTEARQNIAVVFWKQEQEEAQSWAVGRGVVRVVVQNREAKEALSSRAFKATRFWQTVNTEATEATANSLDSVRIRWDFNTIKYLAGEDRKEKGIYRSATMRDVAQLPFVEVLNQQSHAFTLCSVLNILGVLAELAEETSATTEDKLFAGSFSKLAQVLSFPVPNWTDEKGSAKPGSQNQEETVPDSEENNAGPGSTEDANRSLLNALRRWSLEFTQTIRVDSSINVHLIARVWSRFYFTLLRIGESVAKKDLFLNRLLHRQIIAFLSAALIEEMHDKAAMPSYENPTGDDRYFLRNLRRAFASVESSSILDANLKSPMPATEEKSEPEISLPDVSAAIDKLKAKYPLFYVFFSCPLWACYLDPAASLDEPRAQPANSDTGEHFTLLDLQVLHWAKWLPEANSAESVAALLSEARNVLEVDYAVTATKTHVFPNLYDLLSSIPVASGRTSIPRRPRKS